MHTAFFGYAEADITPSGSVQTIGFGRGDEWSRGVERALRAQVSVWRLGGEACCLAAVDHIGFSKQHAGALREEIGAMLGASCEKVMLCFSHTHSAPNDSLELEWYASARESILCCVREALQNMGPVRAAWGNAAVDIGVNRRAESAHLDRRAGILKVEDANTGELKLLLLRLTAHANALKGDNYRLSPDFFGAVRDRLGAEYGCAVMVTQGASGNVAPKYYKSETVPVDAQDPEKFVRSETALDDMAGEVLRAVGGVLHQLRPRDVERLQMYSDALTLYADVPSMARARKIAAEARAEAGIDGEAWLREVQRLVDAGIESQVEAVEIQYFAVNDGCLAGVPNEILCEFALRAADALGCDAFHLGGYTNGCTGYFPTEEEYLKGGFEVYWSMLIYYIYHGRVAALNRDSAPEFLKAVVRHAPAGLPRRGEPCA
jgi:hypothetical protein